MARGHRYMSPRGVRKTPVETPAPEGGPAPAANAAGAPEDGNKPGSFFVAVAVDKAKGIFQLVRGGEKDTASALRWLRENGEDTKPGTFYVTGQLTKRQ